MKVLSYFCAGFTFTASLAFAHGKAHEHGVAKLDVAFEGNNGVIEFESPAANIYGFEHKARSAKDKKLVEDKVEILKTKISEMVVFDKKSECIISVKEVEAFANEKKEDATESQKSRNQAAKNKKTHHGTHSEVLAKYIVSCKNSLAGTSLQFGFAKYFPALKKLKVQAINGEKQNGATIQNDKGKIDL